MDILKRDNLPKGGFAGLKEHRLVKEPRLFGANENSDGSWPGIGRFVYFADARFMPHGETHMHPHHEVDVISVMVDGNIKHEGSLEHGNDLKQNEVQVQRAGAEGFSHNEINPDADWNRMLQLWFLPEVPGQPADYKVYQPESGILTRIYGGEEESGANTTTVDFPAKTKMDVAMLENGQSINIEESFIAYITRGNGLANTKQVSDGDMFRGEALKFEATDSTQLIVIHTAGDKS